MSASRDKQRLAAMLIQRHKKYVLGWLFEELFDLPVNELAELKSAQIKWDYLDSVRLVDQAIDLILEERYGIGPDAEIISPKS